MSAEKWKRELDSLVDKLEQHSMASLWRIKRECDRSGMPVDRRFRKLFLRTANARIAETFDRVEKQQLPSESNKCRESIIRHSRSKSRVSRHSRSKSSVSRRSQSKSRVSRRSRSKSRCFRSKSRSKRRSRSRSNRRSQSKCRLNRCSQSKSKLNKRSRSKSRLMPTKSVSNSSNCLPSIPFKPSTSQSGDCSRGISVRSLSRKTEVDRSSPQQNIETRTKSIALNEVSRVSKVIEMEVAAELQYDSMTFVCFHCTNSKNSSDFYTDDIELIYGHWLSAHTDLPKAKPFQFYVTQLVACHFCDVLGTFSEVVEHQKTVHPNDGLIIANQSNRKNCSLCNHVGNLNAHFEVAHNNILSNETSNPFRVTNEILKEILSIDIHQKCQCGHCATIFETVDELEHHHSMEHSELAIDSKQIHDEKKADLQCGECNLKVNQDEYFRHLEDHSFQFKCSECEFRTKILTELTAHNERVHRNNVVIVRSEEFTQHLTDVHCKSKMIFSNGLVLTNFNLMGTKYDKSSEFAEVLRALEEKVDSLVCKRSETVSTDSNHGKSGDHHTNNSIDRNEISESDTNTNTNTNSDAFSMSSESSSASTLSLSSSVSPIPTQTTLSKSELQAELKKQNELVNNLSITGIPMLANENLLRIFDRICVKINAPVTQRDVSKIFRTAGPNQPIIVKLRTWTAKAKIKRCFKHKELWSSEIVSLPSRMSSTKVFVNLHTTRFYGRMVQIAKYYKMTGMIQSYYLSENGLLVRSHDGEQDFPVLSKQELINWVKSIKSKRCQRKSERDIRLPNKFKSRTQKYRRYN